MSDDRHQLEEMAQYWSATRFAHEHWGRVCDIARSSDDPDEAIRAMVEEFKISTVDAMVVLDVPVRRLVRRDVASVIDQLSEVRRRLDPSQEEGATLDVVCHHGDPGGPGHRHESPTWGGVPTRDHEVMTLARLVGPMLGAEFSYARGIVEVRSGGDHYEEVFEYRGSVSEWSMRRSDGISFESTLEGSTTRTPGSIEHGPPMRSIIGHFGELLRPRDAYLWGRPGEDWRPTGRISLDSAGYDLELEHIVAGPRAGNALVNRHHFYISDLWLLDTSCHMTEIHFEEKD